MAVLELAKGKVGEVAEAYEQVYKGHEEEKAENDASLFRQFTEKLKEIFYSKLDNFVQWLYQEAPSGVSVAKIYDMLIDWSDMELRKRNEPFQVSKALHGSYSDDLQLQFTRLQKKKKSREIHDMRTQLLKTKIQYKKIVDSGLIKDNLKKDAFAKMLADIDQ